MARHQDPGQARRRGRASVPSYEGPPRASAVSGSVRLDADGPNMRGRSRAVDADEVLAVARSLLRPRGRRTPAPRRMPRPRWRRRAARSSAPAPRPCGATPAARASSRRSATAPARRSPGTGTSTPCRRARSTPGRSDPFAGEVVDGRLIGRGACDMKGPVAAALVGAAAVVRAEIELAGLVTFHLAPTKNSRASTARRCCGDRGLLTQDAAIVGEPSDLADRARRARRRMGHAPRVRRGGARVPAPPRRQRDHLDGALPAAAARGRCPTSSHPLCGRAHRQRRADRAAAARPTWCPTAASSTSTGARSPARPTRSGAGPVPDARRGPRRADDPGFDLRTEIREWTWPPRRRADTPIAEAIRARPSTKPGTSPPDVGFTGITDARFYHQRRGDPHRDLRPGSTSAWPTPRTNRSASTTSSPAPGPTRGSSPRSSAARPGHTGIRPGTGYPGCDEHSHRPADRDRRRRAQDRAARREGGPRRADPASPRSRRRVLRVLLRARVRRGGGRRRPRDRGRRRRSGAGRPPQRADRRGLHARVRPRRCWVAVSR